MKKRFVTLLMTVQRKAIQKEKISKTVHSLSFLSRQVILIMKLKLRGFRKLLRRQELHVS